MDAEMREKPIVTGKDAERFLEKVRRNNRRIEARRARKKELIRKGSAAINNQYGTTLKMLSENDE
ncbi:hypothetical protein OZL92_17650 [Bacillus sonorensis]|uniref:Uncharacterized protein n=2 Tax=Bacillus sonorensis TaxID=119858 RepID=M5PBM8_9BACI|nr:MULTISPECIES: hypothetical protein [Bacillus]TWK84177.1 hypothetical protein CHCC20335_4245 [Bacillus paralicheniformis]ASB89200.1 hypothetical protein S101395_02693 [Bacillus sonorensis]EME72157.1 hypothetical protein BSONL12_22695 [Bacillus sonorensis L12]MCY7858723.1 hypothetical protein [Bacillus sonorensis]MCY8026822.1 hypothetical protein [Bacillus sonorensis]